MSTSEPRSKRQKERINEKNKNDKNKVMYVSIAVAAAVALIIIAWFLMQPAAPATLDSMKKALDDEHYDNLSDISSSSLPTNATGGLRFTVSIDGHGTQTISIYEFGNNDQAKAYAATITSSGQATIVKGVFVLHTDHAHGGQADEFIVTLFNALVNNKSLPHNPGHNH
jgi:SNF family Na+-dependent transporter